MKEVSRHCEWFRRYRLGERRGVKVLLYRRGVDGHSHSSIEYISTRCRHIDWMAWLKAEAVGLEAALEAQEGGCSQCSNRRTRIRRRIILQLIMLLSSSQVLSIAPHLLLHTGGGTFTDSTSSEASIAYAQITFYGVPESGGGCEQGQGTS